MGKLRFSKISNELGNILEFRTGYRHYLFLIILIVLGLIPIKLLENMPNLSICSRLFGERCYSVGLTRGISALIKGDVNLAINYNFLSIPVLAIMILIIILDTYRLYKKIN